MRVRAMVASGDRDALLGELQSARVARRNLPTGLPVDEQLVEFRIPIEDRPGTLAQVLTLATELGVNVADLEIAHSLEGRSGVLVLVVSNDADGFECRAPRARVPRRRGHRCREHPERAGDLRPRAAARTAARAR